LPSADSQASEPPLCELRYVGVTEHRGLSFPDQHFPAVLVERRRHLVRERAFEWSLLRP